MKVDAVQFCKRFSMRGLNSKFGKKVVLRDPLIVAIGSGKSVVFLKYGVVLFWGISPRERAAIMKSVAPFMEEELDEPLYDSVTVVTGNHANEVRGDKIFVTEFTVERIAIISLVIGRSVAIDRFEREVGDVLRELDDVMKSFAESGKTRLSTRQLIVKVGFAMQTRHIAVRQFALLDKPDITWEDSQLDRFYTELSEDYELNDRFRVLDEKLETIFRDAEFIVTYLHGRQSNLLEIIIVVLLVVEIIIFVYEVMR